MIVRFKGSESAPQNLIGGQPQGTLLGGTQYIIASDNCSKEKVNVEDRFKFFDDLNLLEFIILTDQLQKYDFSNHIPSDVGENHLFLPTENFRMQGILNDMTDLTNDNLMKINEGKSNYIIYSRSKQEFSTRLYLNEAPLERVSVIKLLGLWLEEDMSWNENTKQICTKAFSRVRMLSQLKYAGISRDDLLTIYKLFIRSVTEYCSVVFHSSLTQKQEQKIELVQKVCLRVILSGEYSDYQSALKLCNLLSLKDRRSDRMVKFASK